MTRIAVLGLGLMGLPMARRLADQGHDVAAWNQSPVDATRLLERNLTLVPSAAEAVAAAELVIAALSDGPASLAVLGGHALSDQVPKDTIVADMGSNDPATARVLAARLGPRFVDAPVSGGPTGAAAGSLSIFLGAGPAAADRAALLLAPLGRVTHMGPVGAGQAAKLANQVIVACALAGLAEGFAAAEAMGLDPGALAHALEGGYADSQVLRVVGPRMIAGDFAPRGRTTTHLKDLGNAFASLPPGAEAALAATAAARAHLRAALDRRGDLDHAVMLLSVREALGDAAMSPRPHGSP